jgi:hypothetical protein
LQEARKSKRYRPQGRGHLLAKGEDNLGHKLLRERKGTWVDAGNGP